LYRTAFLEAKQASQQTETIQVQVPTDLARRLRLHYDNLPEILERGLRSIEGETETGSTPPPGEPESAPDREQVLAALRSAGILVDLDPAIAVNYVASAEQQQHTPVKVDGTPLSELIIAERRQRWNDSE
jgi:hypothetical protein